MEAYRAYCRLKRREEERLVVDRTLGKPLFRKETGEGVDVYFSLSHSGDITACAVSDKEVGFDIQKHDDRDFNALSKRLFGYEITEKEAFFDRFSQGESRVKLENGGFFTGLKEGGGQIYRIFDGYSAAVCGGSEPVFFEEIFKDIR